MRVCLGVGGVKVCLRAKVSVRKNARVFISKVFRVIWCEYTTFTVQECVYLRVYDDDDCFDIALFSGLQ